MSGIGYIKVEHKAGLSVLAECSFQYPLKLISPNPQSEAICVYMLSYGGGLVSGDDIALTAHIGQNCNVCFLTQGSTKVFKEQAGRGPARQNMKCNIGPHAVFVLLPDPVVPFRESSYIQKQRFYLDDTASVLVLDWLTEGRSAYAEHWSFRQFATCNEIFRGTRLLVRDATRLEDQEGGRIQDRMNSCVCSATILVHGPKFDSFCEDLQNLYDNEDRVRGGSKVGPLWAVSRVRDCTIIKAASNKVEELREKIYEILRLGCILENIFGTVIFQSFK